MPTQAEIEGLRQMALRHATLAPSITRENRSVPATSFIGALRRTPRQLPKRPAKRALGIREIDHNAHPMRFVQPSHEAPAAAAPIRKSNLRFLDDDTPTGEPAWRVVNLHFPTAMQEPLLSELS